MSKIEKSVAFCHLFQKQRPFVYGFSSFAETAATAVRLSAPTNKAETISRQNGAAEFPAPAKNGLEIHEISQIPTLKGLKFSNFSKVNAQKHFLRPISCGKATQMTKTDRNYFLQGSTSTSSILKNKDGPLNSSRKMSPDLISQALSKEPALAKPQSYQKIGPHIF